nr:ATP synthase F0 subunit 8 [Hypnea sp.]
MPQLDRIIIFSQIFWLFIVFSVLYAILTHFFLPLFLKSLKLRKHVIEANNLEIIKLDNKFQAKQIIIKQKLLRSLLIIEKFLNENYQFKKHLKITNQNLFIDEKIGLASINYMLYCDSIILKNILFYPKFMNFKI